MIPPVNSLVKYDNPILVASTKGKKAADPKAAAPKVPPAATQTEDILNSILPPRFLEYIEYRISNDFMHFLSPASQIQIN